MEDKTSPDEVQVLQARCWDLEATLAQMEQRNRLLGDSRLSRPTPASTARMSAWNCGFT